MFDKPTGLIAMAGKKRTDAKGRILKDNELQRKDGSYMYRYYDSKGILKTEYSWKLVPTDKTPKGKRDGLSLREKEDIIIKDKCNNIDSAAKKKVTLNQMFDKYIDGKNELKASTRANYKYSYEHFVRGSFGKKLIADIKYSDVKKFYNSLAEKGLKANSINNIHTLLHPTFTLAIRDDIIMKNPADGVMAEVKKMHNMVNEKKHALTEAQQGAFIDFVGNSDIYKHWLPLFTVFLGTGCRVGELIGLRWFDCNFKNNTIEINHNLIYRLQEDGTCEMHITTPKTNAGIRTIPMFKEVRKILLEERERQMSEVMTDCKIDGYSGFIFRNRFGNPHNPSTINRAIQRIYKAYNEKEMMQAKKEHREELLIPHFSVHNLRHTFCTRFCENETNVKIIQEIMGHADITTTMNIYAEVSEEKKQESFQNLEGKIKIS